MLLLMTLLWGCGGEPMDSGDSDPPIVDEEPTTPTGCDLVEVGYDTPAFKMLRRRIKRLLAANNDEGVYRILHELDEWETKSNRLGGAVPACLRCPTTRTVSMPRRSSSTSVLC